eukprot:7174172-Pyramimonas_sp.AAC.1
MLAAGTASAGVWCKQVQVLAREAAKERAHLGKGRRRRGELSVQTKAGPIRSPFEGPSSLLVLTHPSFKQGCVGAVVTGKVAVALQRLHNVGMSHSQHPCLRLQIVAPRVVYVTIAFTSNNSVITTPFYAHITVSASYVEYAVCIAQRGEFTTTGGGPVKGNPKRAGFEDTSNEGGGCLGAFPRILVTRARVAVTATGGAFTAVESGFKVGGFELTSSTS